MFFDGLNSLRHPIRLLVVGILLACPARTQAQDVGEVAGLKWLAGCWLMRSGALTIEEQWLAPGGGILLGTSRTTRGDSLVAYEGRQRGQPRTITFPYARTPCTP